MNEIKILIGTFGEDAVVEEQSSSYSEGTCLGIMKKIPETDNQMNARITREAIRNKNIQEQELAEFKRLSAKFNKEN